MGARLFGTDGVRGLAGEFLTAELAMALGRAAAGSSPVSRPQVLLIRDTRVSGEMLQAALAAGIASAGGDAFIAGVLPTPAAPLLLDRHGFDLAAVISASHNPYEDNGIKFFGPDGYKLSDEQELAIEELLAAGHPQASAGVIPANGVAIGADAAADRAPPAELDGPASGTCGADDAGPASRTGAAEGAGPASGTGGAQRGTRIGRVRDFDGAREDYLEALQRRFEGLDLGGLDVLLDCANGATFGVAPEAFRALGAKVSLLGDDPDGTNINAGCGSTHVGQLAAGVLEGGHALGFAFDGDGDRVLAVDRAGLIVDGDELVALIARHLRNTDRLMGGGVVVTVMSNYGFHQAMESAEIAVATTSVGDRYVLEELIARGWVLGGEQSGHVIELQFNPCGDGIATALLALEALAGGDLSERPAMEKLPQRLVNVRVKARDSYRSTPRLLEAVQSEDQRLEGRGRVLVRPSGTEPVVRVMVEAPSEQEADEVCGRLVGLLERELGGAG